MRFLQYITLGAVALACAPASVQPYGPGLYTVSYGSIWGSGKARNAAVSDANEFCDSRGAAMVPVSENSAAGSFELTFRCTPGN